MQGSLMEAVLRDSRRFVRVRTHNQAPLLRIKIEFAGKGLREFLPYI